MKKAFLDYFRCPEAYADLRSGETYVLVRDTSALGLTSFAMDKAP
jgi:hypothetical protein